MPPVAVSHAVLGELALCRSLRAPSFHLCSVALARARLEGAISTVAVPFSPRRLLQRRRGSAALGDLTRATDGACTAAGHPCAPAIQAVTGSLNRLNAEIKQMCVEKRLSPL